MDKPARDRVRRLFVQATKLIEEAHECAAFGQDARHSTRQQKSTIRRLRSVVRELDVALDQIEAMLSRV